jgi:putative tricarboxylic transport membrane protein
MYSRRDVLKTGLVGSASLALPFAPFSPAWAQALTSLNLFIPAAPGGGWDGTGRSIELAMRTDGIIKEFKFEHVPGAGGTVGLPRFLGRKGQGDAVMVAGMVMIGSAVANNSPVQLTDATPLMRLTAEFEVIVVPADSPHKTMKDLVAAFKADPGKVSWAGGSAGGTDHILAGLIAKNVGVDPKRIAYVAYAGGGPAQAALLGNQVTCGVSGYSEFAEQIKVKKLRAIAISSEKRQEGIDVPTLIEQGVNVELANWRGVFGAPGITAPQQKALIDLFTRMTNGPTWKSELKKKDWIPIYLSGADFGKYIIEDTKRIAGILIDLGLKKA